jgi:hypothetical protein
MVFAATGPLLKPRLDAQARLQKHPVAGSTQPRVVDATADETDEDEDEDEDESSTAGPRRANETQGVSIEDRLLSPQQLRELKNPRVSAGQFCRLQRPRLTERASDSERQTPAR